MAIFYHFVSHQIFDRDIWRVQVNACFASDFAPLLIFAPLARSSSLIGGDGWVQWLRSAALTQDQF